MATSSPLDQAAQQDGTTANASSREFDQVGRSGELILGDLENVNAPGTGSGFQPDQQHGDDWLSNGYSDPNERRRGSGKLEPWGYNLDRTGGDV